ncbi:hypothetical protein EJ06DRAFT_521099 [Trichodelitschia bisporula]|uniref:Uncharacterized protein n=1 Tax=Trichodelitschia bisporula TaxID=703511 RepID=A0A6G1HZ09_9PEZI|nr:hypothetical protein EJ06DRAFT_521099 [Trichodelitschia bisporula]
MQRLVLGPLPSPSWAPQAFNAWNCTCTTARRLADSAILSVHGFFFFFSFFIPQSRRSPPSLRSIPSGSPLGALAQAVRLKKSGLMTLAPVADAAALAIAGLVGQPG